MTGSNNDPRHVRPFAIVNEHYVQHMDRFDRLIAWTQRHRRATLIGGSALILALGTGNAFLSRSTSPSPYALPKGEIISAPFDVTSIPGNTIVDRDIKQPTTIGLGTIEYDSNGFPNGDREVYLGARIVPQPDGSTEIVPLEGSTKPVYVELVGTYTLALADGATVTLSGNPDPRITGVTATFTSQQGALFPQT